MEGGGFDRYSHGDTYGYGINISFNGNFMVFRRIYVDSNDQKGIKNVEHRTGSFSKDSVAYLSGKLEEYSFFKYPTHLPTGGPEANIKTPSESVIISARRKPEHNLKTVHARLGGDRNHYPEHFFKLRNMLRSVLGSAR